jgi:hypothetical protein
MSDASDLDVAIFTVLDDPTLLALVPDGIYWGQASQGQTPKTKFVIVAQTAHEDLYEFQDEAFERFTYQITARTKDSSTVTVDSAAARIRVLMAGLITATGYEIAAVHRIERIKYGESDPTDPATVWQHAGGLYDILAQPTIP